ncbi:MAG: PAS domain-containing protein [Candidatus Delongbacteria bacterium]|nr:PAS domain-containing protein [Candidatus Cloacimonadota bacterium]MCB9472643.1 PAS domain-containing protein [Candidatus Delongbacteria bacterium]
MKNRRLFLQLFPALLATLLVSLALLAVFAGRSFRQQTFERQQQDLLERAQLLAPSVIDLLESNQRDALDRLLLRIGPSSHTRITIMALNGIVLAETDEDPASMENHGTRPEMLAALQSGEGHSIRFSKTLQQEMVYVALRLDRDGTPRAVVRTSIPLHDVREAVSRIYQFLFLCSLVLALIAAGLALWITRRISRPIEGMRHAAELYASGRLSFRLEAVPISELSALALAMNRMAGSLEEKIASLARERNMREALLDSMNEGVVGLDKAGRILFVNRAAVRLLGLPGDRLHGNLLLDMLPLEELRQALMPALVTRGSRELCVPWGETDLRYLALGVTTLHDLDDQEIGSLAVFSEITRMRRLERVREDFVANVSHELRTPITSIRGFVESLNEGALEDPPTARRFLGIIERQVVRLSAIIDDLLALSRIERDEQDQTVEFQLTGLRAVIEEALGICEFKARERRVNLAVECAGDPHWVLNAAMLERALINLVENAIKYSPEEGTVTLRVDPGESELRLTIEDQGPGIPAEHLPRLFERFYVVDRARSRSMGGTGLGLSIVKHIARTHQGRVSVDSRPGAGSRFTLHLPADPSAPAPSA